MVPHGRVEEELRGIVARLAQGLENAPDLAVTAIPDERRGEQLVVVHTPFEFSVESVLRELSKSDLPRLFQPRATSFIEVAEIPKLGTGKTDLAQLRSVAAARL